MKLKTNSTYGVQIKNAIKINLKLHLSCYYAT